MRDLQLCWNYIMAEHKSNVKHTETLQMEFKSFTNKDFVYVFRKLVKFKEMFIDFQ